VFELWPHDGVKEALDVTLIYEHWSVSDPGDLPESFNPIGELFARYAIQISGFQFISPSLLHTVDQISQPREHGNQSLDESVNSLALADGGSTIRKGFAN
jgi:hypothetical protein